MTHRNTLTPERLEVKTRALSSYLWDPLPRRKVRGSRLCFIVIIQYRIGQCNASSKPFKLQTKKMHKQLLSVRMAQINKIGNKTEHKDIKLQ